MKAGEYVEVHVLEGTRPIRQVRVQRLVHDFMGANAYMTNEALHRLMREAGSVSGGYLTVDPQRGGAFLCADQADACRRGRAAQTRSRAEFSRDHCGRT